VDTKRQADERSKVFRQGLMRNDGENDSFYVLREQQSLVSDRERERCNSNDQPMG
jgi:hypothetical protein